MVRRQNYILLPMPAVKFYSDSTQMGDPSGSVQNTKQQKCRILVYYLKDLF
jgi:hypothetical protein